MDCAVVLTSWQSLNDFKSTSCIEPFAYAYLWGSLIVSVAVYGVDTFTAVNLIAFDKWAGSIEPKVPLNISKWIFSGCIILSWLNLAYEHIRAARVMRRGAVAESYLDSLAVRIQSIRVGKGRGWRRFLVFAELTKSKKGAEYVALFTYFSFQCKSSVSRMCVFTDLLSSMGPSYLLSRPTTSGQRPYSVLRLHRSIGSGR